MSSQSPTFERAPRSSREILRARFCSAITSGLLVVLAAIPVAAQGVTVTVSGTVKDEHDSRYREFDPHDTWSTRSRRVFCPTRCGA